MKISPPRPWTLSVLPAPPASSPTGVTAVSERAIAATSSPASPIPSSAPTNRCPRSSSTTASELSRPTSISTNRNSIITAPV